MRVYMYIYVYIYICMYLLIYLLIYLCIYSCSSLQNASTYGPDILETAYMLLRATCVYIYIYIYVENVYVTCVYK